MSDSPSLWQDCRQFLDYCSYLNRSPQTVRTYRQMLSDLVAYCTKTNRPVARVEDLTLPVITAFLAWKRTHTSASTLAKYASCLRSMLRYFSLHEDRDVIPYDKVQLPKLQRHAPRNVPTAEDIVHLFRSIPQDTPQGRRDRALVMLFFSTGLRLAELCALDRSDLPIERLGADQLLQIIIRGKGDKDRPVFLQKGAQLAVREYLITREDDYPPLFIRYRPGMRAEDDAEDREKRLSPRMVRKIITQHARRSGVGHLAPHALRHGFAVDLLRNDVNLRVIQELFFFYFMSTTEIYT
ncbi:MAG: tyrosine-type recombinase/integrase, partial [Chloroflexota bacterium]|nr:tyrosine-type recombinase/integrase [Chloroflexota bacterium]